MEEIFQVVGEPSEIHASVSYGAATSTFPVLLIYSKSWSLYPGSMNFNF